VFKIKVRGGGNLRKNFKARNVQMFVKRNNIASHIDIVNNAFTSPIRVL